MHRAGGHGDLPGAPQASRALRIRFSRLSCTIPAIEQHAAVRRAVDRSAECPLRRQGGVGQACQVAQQLVQIRRLRAAGYAGRVIRRSVEQPSRRAARRPEVPSIKRAGVVAADRMRASLRLHAKDDRQQVREIMRQPRGQSVPPCSVGGSVAGPRGSGFPR